jgi:hypothetical protein
MSIMNYLKDQKARIFWFRDIAKPYILKKQRNQSASTYY